MEEYIYKSKEPKTIVYDYLFNYLGKDTFQEKRITSACVQLAIRAYKNGEEVKTTSELNYENIYLSDIYKVSFDRASLFRIEKNMKYDNLFRLLFEWDTIESEAVGYTLDYLDVLPDELRKDLPEQFMNLPCSSPMKVTEREFKDFLRRNIDEFDISDNVNAQVPSVSYV